MVKFAINSNGDCIDIGAVAAQDCCLRLVGAGKGEQLVGMSMPPAEARARTVSLAFGSVRAVGADGQGGGKRASLPTAENISVYGAAYSSAGLFANS